MKKRIKALGILNIVLGSLGAICGMLIILLLNGPQNVIAAISGHRLSDSGAWPLDMRIVLLMVMLLLLLSIPSIIAGIGLLLFERWAKILIIVVSGLHLFIFPPFGTALGIYGLWILCSPKSKGYFISTKNSIYLKFNP